MSLVESVSLNNRYGAEQLEGRGLLAAPSSASPHRPTHHPARQHILLYLLQKASAFTDVFGP